MKHTKWLKGVGVTMTFLGSLFIALEMIATSSPDYKNMVDSVFGIQYSSNISSDLGTFSYRSSFDNSVDLITERARIAAQLEEEGIVMLKNNGGVLPLRKAAGQSLNITILGSRAFTFKNNATRAEDRDGYVDDPPITDYRQMNVYAGICGSRTYKSSVTLKDGLTNIPITLLDALGHENINVNPSCEAVYANKPFPNHPAGSEANGVAGGPFSIGEPHVDRGEFSGLDTYKDAVLVVIGRMSGEGREYFPGYNGVSDHSDGSQSALHLSNDERNLIDVAKSISDNVVVLLNSAIPMEIDELKTDNRVSSVLWIGLPGSYGMDGVARVLSGKANPSGSLPDVFAVDASASPAAQNFGVNSQDGQPFAWSNPGDCTAADNGHYVVLAEGIYDGYYYYETRYADSVEGKGNASSAKGAGRGKTGSSWKYEDEVSYTFGHGLSYTDFKVEREKIDGADYRFNPESLSLDVAYKVTNIGSVAGKKSVQVYASSPFTDYDKANRIEKSAIQLVGFEKTKLLQPSESETLTINVPLKYLASYSESVNHDSLTGGYILEGASYYLSTGNGAHEALNNILVKKDAMNSNKLFLENDVEPNADLVVTFNPSLEGALTSLDRGSFGDGINATLLNKNEDGVLISNQLQSANYNFYKPNAITYLSRTDWDSTFPVAYHGLEITSGMELYLGKGKGNGGHVYQYKSGTVKELWGVDHAMEEDDDGNPMPQEVIANFKNAKFDDERWDYLIEQITFEEASMFGPNGGSNCNAFTSINAPETWQADGPNGNLTKTLAELASSSGPMALEKNDVNASYKSCDMPCEPIIAATFNKELVHEEGQSFGEMSLWDNCKIVWAPGMNLHRCPFNSRNHEYYSEDPMLTNIMGTSFVRGGLEKGAILSAKHFAFNSQESYREGLSQFMTEQAAREMELRGFQGVIEDPDVQTPGGTRVNGLGLMSSFSRIGCTGVNAHTGLMVNVLRKEWGFKGLISTDFCINGRYFNPQDCTVNNVTFMACGNAGSLFKAEWAEYPVKVKTDPTLHAALKENMHYYLYALCNSSALNGFDGSTKAVDSASIVSPWQTGFIVGGGCALGVSVALFAVYLIVNRRKNSGEVSE